MRQAGRDDAGYARLHLKTQSAGEGRSRGSLGEVRRGGAYFDIDTLANVLSLQADDARNYGVSGFSSTVGLFHSEHGNCGAVGGGGPAKEPLRLEPVSDQRFLFQKLMVNSRAENWNARFPAGS